MSEGLSMTRCGNWKPLSEHVFSRVTGYIWADSSPMDWFDQFWDHSRASQRRSTMNMNQCQENGLEAKYVQAFGWPGLSG